MAVGVVGLFILGIFLAVRTREPIWIFLSLPFTLVLFIAARCAPTGYRLATDGVHVERRAGDKVLPYRSIRGVDREARPLNGFTVHGWKGVFGRFGRFWSMSLGFYRLWLTNGHNVVWLDTVDGWVALSPDRPDEFVERLRARL